MKHTLAAVLTIYSPPFQAAHKAAMGVDEEDTSDPAYMPLSEPAAQKARSTAARRPAAKRAASLGDDSSDADEQPKVQVLACLPFKAGSVQTAPSLCFMPCI